MPTTPPIPDRANGETIDEDWFNIPKSAVYDHEDRIFALETIPRQIQFKVDGLYYDFETSSNLPIPFLSTVKILEDISLLSGQIWIESAGSSGTTAIDMLFKRGAGAWTSLFTTLPSAAFSSGDDFTSANGVLNVAFVDLLAGDLLRMDVTNMQAGTPSGFAGMLNYKRTI